MKKLAPILLVSLFLSLSACNGAKNDNNTEKNTSNTEIVENNQKDSSFKKIGIIQTDVHPALDASKDGFIDALKKEGFEEGKNIIIDEKNALGDQSNLKTISQSFVSDKKDIVLAIATPAASAIAMETKEIPIVITAVTDPEDAGLVKSNNLPETNVTGTSDLNPIKEQLELLLKILPDTKNLAIMYSSKESNSEFQAKLAEKYANELGISTSFKTVSSKADIVQVTQSIVGNFDALYIPTDNDIANAMTAVGSVAIPGKLPIVAGEEGMVSTGGIASVSIDYYQLGYKAGEMAAIILRGENKPQDMAIEYAPSPTLIVNKKICDQLEITVPEDILSAAKIINE